MCEATTRTDTKPDYVCDHPLCHASVALPTGDGTCIRTTHPDGTYSLYCSSNCQKTDAPEEQLAFMF